MRKLLHLQMLRAVAATCVVVDHAMASLIGAKYLSQTYEKYGWLLGWLGVAMFFVTSGIIMVRTAGSGFGSFSAARHFAFRRFIRIAPLYYIATFVIIAIAFHRFGFPSLEHLLKSILFIPYAINGSSVVRPVLSQGWTLNYEIFFYLLFSIALYFRRPVAISLLLSAFVLLVLLGALARPLIPYVDPTTPFAFWTDPIILLFAIGS